MIDPSIFRAYDIRGNASKTLSLETAYNVGFHFAKMITSPMKNKIVVGFDGRLSSNKLYEALTLGLIDGGGDVSSIGLCTSPMLYFADQKFFPEGSIMITGSHNPKEDNGFKMLAGGASFYGDNIQKLLSQIVSNPQKYIAKTPLKKIYPVNMRPFYIERILKNIAINPDLKIVWDPGNGSSGVILRSIIEKMPNLNFIINEEVDGNFPNHHPDPTIPENLAGLIESVSTHDADLGIAFDGDGDRIGVVTRSGKIVFGDQLLCLYATELLQRKPGSIIIADVKASQTLFDYVLSIGGKALMWKTGHSLIKAKMKETGAEIAGEMSGHIFFKDGYLGFDDGIYAGLRLIDVITKSNISLDEFIENLPKAINTPEIRIDVEESKKFQIIEKIKDKLRKLDLTYCDIDGVRLNIPEGWWLLRASNTQAALIARCESNTDERLQIVIKNLNKFLKDFKLGI